ncbi:cupin domain-containing protein [Allosediminivita pacifica]|uniref:Quercetin dioxygenase-like cupin family protein n=1 Tax=Allosediminivita pacifica TaxID=1267769 RepID=A0A2T6B7T2_9RHOB|nr:cupin domain-containing protein [Allosediminivita pacifica]PTX52127.1 quercetin dioxygenase-like cupin family protein [Allosediminivita pacifica]GGA96926.1 germin subfamily 1 member 15 [Allosediminivita pacifica]
MTVIPFPRPAAAPDRRAPFTGPVRIDMPSDDGGPASTGGRIVTFGPGARTAWHVPPHGQLLIVTAGAGWLQRAGEDKTGLRTGDTVWVEAGERHWLGGTATSPMTCFVLQDGGADPMALWDEQVSDEVYLA